VTYTVIFSEVSENKFVGQRNPLSKAINWSILRDFWITVSVRRFGTVSQLWQNVSYGQVKRQLKTFLC